MRQNDDNKTVAAMDILMPGIGEVIGGSQREERLNILNDRMSEMNISKKELWWYLETRKFGTVPWRIWFRFRKVSSIYYRYA